jgi:hypothetical protein
MHLVHAVRVRMELGVRIESTRQLVTLMQDVQQRKAEQNEFRQELWALFDIVCQLQYEQ